MKEKLTLRERVIATPKEKIVRALIVVAVIATIIGIVAVLLNAKTGLNWETFIK